MKERGLFGSILLVAACFLASFVVAEAANDPCLISDHNDLLAISQNSALWGGNFLLTNDITIPPDVNIDPIGNDSTNFTGVFDGNGHVISGLTQSGSSYLGLFGYTGPSAQISSLGVVDANVNCTGGYAGILVGRNLGGQISNCQTTGSVTGGYGSRLGGLVGWNGGPINNCQATSSVIGVDELGGLVGRNSGPIRNCQATGSVTGVDDLGGLVGCNYGEISNCFTSSSVEGYDRLGGLVGWNTGPIRNCQATASVTGGFDSVSLGGLVGSNEDTISNCQASGSVTGDDALFLGGLVGRNWSDGEISSCRASSSVEGYANSYCLGGLVGLNLEGTISNCQATGSVTGEAHSDYVGGLVGSNTQSTISNCYATGSVTGDADVGGLVGINDTATISNCYFLDPADGGGPDNGYGTALTDTEMKQENNFSGWDFVGETANGPNDIWTIKEGVKYPEHVWPMVQYIDWDGVDFRDYSFFTNWWMATDCNDVNDCDSTDLDFSNAVDFSDLDIFRNYWLFGKEY